MSKPLPNSITVCAIYSAIPGLEYLEIKGVDTPSRAIIFRQSFEAGDAETGNFLAIVHALRLLKRHQMETTVIYSDSSEAIQWVKDKKCKGLLQGGRIAPKLVNAMDEAETWLAENVYRTKILKWDAKEWGDIQQVVYPRWAPGEV